LGNEFDLAILSVLDLKFLLKRGVAPHSHQNDDRARHAGGQRDQDATERREPVRQIK